MDQTQARVEAELEANESFGSAASEGNLELVEAFEGMRDGLFEKQMATRFGSRDGDIEVQGGGVGNHHGIGAMRQGGVQVRFHGVSGNFGGSVIGQGAAPGAVEDKVVYAQARQITKVTAANRAKTGDEDFHEMDGNNRYSIIRYSKLELSNNV
jgi:hypothetical protein